MIGATVVMAAMAGLFVVFGLFRLADRRGCEGSCAGCTHECERHVEGDSP